MDARIAFTTYKAVYLLPRIANAAAVEDSRAKGWYRHENVIVASSADHVVAEIRDLGGVPVDIRAYRSQGSWWSRWLAPTVTADYRLQFLQALSFHLMAGASPGGALRAVIEATTGQHRRALNLAQDVLDKGGTFADAVAATGFLDVTSVAILEAGERSGSLRDALASAVEFQRSRENALKIMLGAVTWTVVDLFFAVSAIIGNRFYFLPSLRAQGLKAEDPEDVERFQRALDLAFTINNVLLGLTVLLALGGVWFASYYRNPATRAQAEGLLQRVPFLGSVVVNLSVASTLKIGGALLRGGVSLLAACAIAKRGTRLSSVASIWDSIERRVNSGESVQRALLHPIFDASERLIVAAHNSQQQLGDIFHIIAERRNTLATSAAKRFAVAAFVASLLYSSASVLSSLYVGYIQNKAVMSVSI